MRVCYFINNENINLDDVMQNDEAREYFLNHEAFSSAFSKDIITMFFTNNIEGHTSAWEQAVLDDYDFLALTDKHILGEDFDIGVYRDLLNEYDLLHNENYDFYVVSKKCCEKLQNFTEDSVKKAFHNIKDLKKDILTGV